MKQIVQTTDGLHVGLRFDPAKPLVLSGSEFAPDKVVDLGDGVTRYSNSNYVIDAVDLPEN